jgi:hypothetical protein
MAAIDHLLGHLTVEDVEARKREPTNNKFKYSL